MARKHQRTADEVQERANELAGQWVDKIEIEFDDVASPTVVKRRSLTGGYDIILVVKDLESMWPTK